MEDTAKILEISFGDKVLSKDELVSKIGTYSCPCMGTGTTAHSRLVTEAVEAPRLSFSGGNPSESYIAVSLDHDAPFPSFNFLSPILHSIQADLKVSKSSKTLISSSPYVVNWIGPEPPSASGPHRYVFLLYRQPSGFSSKDIPTTGVPVGLWARIRWNQSAWEKKFNVGQPIAVGSFLSR